jgi:hypothetical protein
VTVHTALWNITDNTRRADDLQLKLPAPRGQPVEFRFGDARLEPRGEQSLPFWVCPQPPRELAARHLLLQRDLELPLSRSLLPPGSTASNGRARTRRIRASSGPERTSVEPRVWQRAKAGRSGALPASLFCQANPGERLRDGLHLHPSGKYRDNLTRTVLVLSYNGGTDAGNNNLRPTHVRWLKYAAGMRELSGRVHRSAVAGLPSPCSRHPPPVPAGDVGAQQDAPQRLPGRGRISEKAAASCG